MHAIMHAALGRGCLEPGANLQQPLFQAAADQGSAAAWVGVRDTGEVRQRMVRREPAGQPGRDPPRRGVQGLSVDAELTVCVQGIHVLAVPLKQLHLRNRQPDRCSLAPRLSTLVCKNGGARELTVLLCVAASHECL